MNAGQLFLDTVMERVTECPVNRWILIGVSTMILLQLLFTYTPLMNTLFKTAPIGLESWGWILGASLLTYLVIELEKWLRRHFGSPRSPR